MRLTGPASFLIALSCNRLLTQPLIHRLPMKSPMPPDLLAWQCTLLGQLVESGLRYFQVLGQVVDGENHVFVGGRHTNSLPCGKPAPLTGVASLSVATDCCQLPLGFTAGCL